VSILNNICVCSTTTSIPIREKNASEQQCKLHQEAYFTFIKAEIKDNFLLKKSQRNLGAKNAGHE